MFTVLVLSLRHQRAVEAAKETAAMRFDNWLIAPEGAQKIRTEAIRIIEEASKANQEVCAQSQRYKMKLPNKKEAESQAREYLVDQHERRERQKPQSPTPFLEEATEL